ncbi:MAG: sigma-70 family RNA polymerase sigma factor [Bryobacterales bacterium]|nr:sigma-70 family RNA polymerase sigma factor [Bryobacterales bacterium]
MLAQERITELLGAWRDGDPDAVRSLLPQVYEELRKIAASAVASNAPLGVSRTELVHEAFLRLSGSKLPEFRNRKHFYAITARLMRIVLVDQARRLRRIKRRDTAGEHSLVDGFAWNAPEDHLTLHRCLEKLEEFSPRKAQMVELRFFGGLELTEIAETLGVSLALVKREILLARSWMARELAGSDTGHEAAS